MESSFTDGLLSLREEGEDDSDISRVVASPRNNNLYGLANNFELSLSSRENEM